MLGIVCPDSDGLYIKNPLQKIREGKNKEPGAMSSLTRYYMQKE
jgi:hypothetical protein